MDTATEQQKKDMDKSIDKYIEETKRKAAAENKDFFVYVAERSNGLRKIFIRWHKEDIEELEQIKSQYE
jgi:hypothetical protein